MRNNSVLVNFMCLYFLGSNYEKVKVVNNRVGLRIGGKKGSDSKLDHIPRPVRLCRLLLPEADGSTVWSKTVQDRTRHVGYGDEGYGDDPPTERKRVGRSGYERHHHGKP